MSDVDPFDPFAVADDLDRLEKEGKAPELPAQQVQGPAVSVEGDTQIPSEIDPFEISRRQDEADLFRFIVHARERTADQAAATRRIAKYTPGAELLPPEAVTDLDRRNAITKALESDDVALSFARDPNMVALIQDDLETLKAIREVVAGERANRIAVFEGQSFFERNFSSPASREFSRVRQAFDLSATIAALDEEERYDRLTDIFEQTQGRDDVFVPLAARIAAGDSPLGRFIRERNQRSLEASAEGVSARAEEISNSPEDVKFNEVLADGSIGDVLSAITADPLRVVRLLTEASVSSAAPLAAGAAGGVTLGPVGAVAAAGGAGYLVEQASALQEALQKRGVDLAGQTPEQVIGLLQSPELRAEVAQAASIKAGVITVFDMLSFHLASKVIAPAIAIAGRNSRAAREVANVALQVPVQGLLEGAGEAAGSFAAFGEIDPNDVLLEAIAGSGMALAEVGVFGGAQMIGRLREGIDTRRALSHQERRSAGLADRVQEVIDLVAKSKTAALDPEALKDYLSRAKEGGLEDVYVDAERLQTFFQGSGVDIDTALANLGITRAEYDDAKRRAGFVAIPIENVALAEGSADLISSLRDDIKDSYEGLTVRETQALRGLSRQEILGTLAELSLSSVDDAQNVFDAVYRRLRATGVVSEKKAKVAATLYQKAFESASRATGISAQRLWERFNPQIVTEGAEGRDVQTELLIAQTRARAERSRAIPELQAEIDDLEKRLLEGADDQLSAQRERRVRRRDQLEAANRQTPSEEVRRFEEELQVLGIDPLEGSTEEVSRRVQELRSARKAFFGDEYEQSGVDVWDPNEVFAETKDADIAAKREKLADEIPGLAGILPYLTDEELEHVRKDTGQKLVAFVDGLPEPEEMAAVAQAGIAKRGWYQRSAEALIQIFGLDDSVRFTALLSALSPRTSVETNLLNALNVWVAWVDAGRPTDVDTIDNLLEANLVGNVDPDAMKAWTYNTRRAFMHDDPYEISISGPKVNSFMLNLQGRVHEVTNDAWMATYAGLRNTFFAASPRKAKPNQIPFGGGKIGGKGPNYLAMSAVTRMAADILTRNTGEAWTAAEVQETVWSWAKAVMEKNVPGVTSREDLVRRGLVTDDDINSVPDFQVLLVEGQYRAILESGGYADQIEEASQHFGGGDQSTPRTSDRSVSAEEREARARAGDAVNAHVLAAAARLDLPRRDSPTESYAQQGLDPGAGDGSAVGSDAGADQPGGGGDGGQSSIPEAFPEIPPLPGVPIVRGEGGPIPRAVAAAEEYARRVGIKLKRQAQYAKVNPARARRIAEEYAHMEHKPDDPIVYGAYRDMIKQTIAQYEVLLEFGFEFYFIDPDNDPYGGNPWPAMSDLRNNNRLGIFPTDAGFGTSEDFDPKENPLLAKTDFYIPGPDGQPKQMLANDVFRAVHDVMGHGLEGAGFRPRGEENAWQAHARLYRGRAVGAMTSETRGQNSWLNFGPHGEHNRTAKVEDTIFADQKTGLMPSWTWTEGFVPGDAPSEAPDGTVTLTHYSANDRLSITDPAYHGTGLDGAELVRKKGQGEKFLDRTYFGMNVGEEGGYKSEFPPDTPVYEARIKASDLYDMDLDPEAIILEIRDNHVIHRRGDGSVLYDEEALLTQYEQEIKARGYRGYFARNPLIGMTAAVFDPMPVKRINPVAKEYKQYLVSPPLNTKKIIEILKANPDGFTVDLAGNPVPPSGFMVALPREQELILEPEEVTEEVIEEMALLLRLFEDIKDERLYIGGWRDEKTGRFHLDISQNIKWNYNEDKARLLAAARNQISYYNLETREVIDTPTDVGSESERLYGKSVQYEKRLIQGFRERDLPLYEQSNFKEFFDGSKVVDADGRPLVVWHGTDGIFTVFDTGRNPKTPHGVFFSDHPTARGYTSYDYDIGHPSLNQILNDGVEFADGLKVIQGRIIVDSRGDAFYADYDNLSEEELAELVDADEGETLGVGYRIVDFRTGKAESPWMSLDEIERDIDYELESVKGGTVPVYLAIKNPLVFDAKGRTWNDLYEPEEKYVVRDEDDYIVEVFETEEEAVREVERAGEGYSYGLEEVAGEPVTTDDIVAMAAEQGYDGVIFKNINDQGPYGSPWGTSDVYVALSSNQIKLAYDNRGTFDPATSDIRYQPTRGSFQISEDRARRVINLFEQADFSTLMHESAHFFLEMYRDLDQETDGLREEIDRLFAWMGVTSWDQIGPQQHEAFAEAFEKYLFEGNPPNAEMRSMFRQMADWMRSIYKTVRQIGFTKVKMDREIADIFDRLLFGSEAVDDISRRDRYLPAFETAEAAGMTPGEYERYRTLAGRAVETAREKMVARLLKDIKRRNTQDRAQTKEAVRAQVAAEVGEEPVWRALTYFRDGRLIGPDSADSEDIEKRRLDAKDVEDVVGKEGLSLLPKITQKKGGLNLEVMAEMMGFGSGQDMLDAIMALGEIDESGKAVYPTLKQEIERRTIERLDQEDGTTLDDDRLREEAIAAMHNADRSDLLMLELSAIERLGAQALTRKGAERQVAEEGAGTAEQRQAAIRKAQRKVDAATALGDEPARQQAILELQSAREAANVARGQRAADRQARLHTKEALSARQQAIRLEARDHVSRMPVGKLDALSRFALDERRASRAANDAIAAKDFAAAAEAKRKELWNHFILIEAQQAKERRDVAMRLFKRWAKVSPKSKVAVAPEYIQHIQNLLGAYNIGRVDPSEARLALDAMRVFVKDKNDAGSQIVIPDTVYQAENIDTAPVSRLDDLKDAVRSLVKNGRDDSEEMKAAFKEKIDLLIQSIEANKAPRTDREELSRIAGGVRDFLDEAKMSHRKAEHLLRELDGMEDLGPLWRAVFQPIDQAASKEIEMRHEAMDRFKSIWSKLKKLDAKSRTKREKIAGLRLSREERIAIALNWGNEGNREAMLNGSRPGWDEGKLNAVVNSLDNDEWDFIEEVWEFINSYWDQISELEERVTGFKPRKVEGETFTVKLADGSARTIRGAYYPIIFDPKLSAASSRDRLEEQARNLMAGTHTRAATSHGYTNERSGSKGSGKRVWLSLDGMFRHVDFVIHDLSHREAVIEVAKVLGNREMETAISEIYGRSAIKYLDGWLKNVAAGSVEPNDMIDIVARHARIGMSVAEMGLSLRTALVQPFGLTQTVARLGAGRVLSAVSQFATNGGPETMVEMVQTKSAYMRDRAKTFDREIADASRRLRPGNKLDTLKDASFWLIGKMDMTVSYPSWVAAYNDAISRGMSEADAILFGDQVVRETQSSGLAKDLAGVQRGGEKARLFTAFYSFFAAYHNMLVDAVERTGIKRRKEGLGAATVYGASQFIWLVVMPALISEVILNGGPEEDEEWYVWAGKVVAQYGFSGMVLVRDFASGLLGDYGYGGPPSFRVAEETINFINQVEQGEVDRALVRSGLMSAGYLGHLPSRQTWRLVEGIWDYSEGEASAGEAIAGTVGLRHFKDN